MSTNLGFIPDDMTLNLIPGQAFTVGFQAIAADSISVGTWPVGAVLVMDFAGLTPAWTAAVDGTDPSVLRFNATAAQVNAVIASASGMRITLNGQRIAHGPVRVITDEIS